MNEIKKEIKILEQLEETPSINNYMNNLIDFAGDTIDDFECLCEKFESLKKDYSSLLEKLGEKKDANPKEVFEPLYSFLKYFN